MVEPDVQEYLMAVKLVEWIQKREMARTQGRSGDPNIDNWRYCNVKRQDDKVTKFITHWLEPWHDHPMLVPNILMARLFNNPETLQDIGYLEEWDPMRIRGAVLRREMEGLRVFNAAYIVSTNGHKMDKTDYLCEMVLPAVFDACYQIGAPDLETFWYELTSFNGVGSFMGAQVIADAKFTPRWRNAPDWWKFVAPGPGSMRGMNRLRGLPANHQKYNPKAFSMYIQPVRSIIKSGTGLNLCAQDVQNCLCEFDKYMRLILGEGRPKQTYKR